MTRNPTDIENAIKVAYTVCPPGISTDRIRWAIEFLAKGRDEAQAPRVVDHTISILRGRLDSVETHPDPFEGLAQ